jgi:hypothetical protein
MSKKPRPVSATPAATPAKPYTIQDQHLTVIAKQLFAALTYVPEGLREGAEMIAKQLLPEIDRRLHPHQP